MTALTFLKSICKSAGLTYSFTRNHGSVVGEYMQLIFQRAGVPGVDFVLWYTIQDSMPLSGDCSVHGQFDGFGDADKAKACLRPLMDALEQHASQVKLALYDKVHMAGISALFSVAGKSCDEIIVEIDLCAKQTE